MVPKYRQHKDGGSAWIVLLSIALSAWGERHCCPASARPQHTRSLFSARRRRTTLAAVWSSHCMIVMNTRCGRFRETQGRLYARGSRRIRQTGKHSNTTATISSPVLTLRVLKR